MTKSVRELENALFNAQTTLVLFGMSYWANKLAELQRKLESDSPVEFVAQEIKALYGGFGSITDNAIDKASVPNGLSFEEANNRLFQVLSNLHKAASAFDKSI